MILKLTCIVVCAFISFSNSAFVDTLQKCSYKDGDCVVGLIQNIMRDIGKDGVKELNIPALDPLDINNVSIPIYGLINVTLDEGRIKGIKDCVISSIHNDMNNGVSNMDLTCDLIVKGKFKIDDMSPFVENMFGRNAINANGNLKLKLDKLHMKMKFFYHMITKEDGDVYFKCHLEDFLYDFEIGDLKMNASKIFFGSQDISDFIVSFFNQYWKFIMPTIGKDIFDVAMKIFKIILHRFFEAVPVKYYLIDDFTPFLKSE